MKGKAREIRAAMRVDITAAEADGERVLSGRATVYGVKRIDTGNNWDIITAAGAFKETLDAGAPDVKFLYQHDRAQVLGSMSGGTMTLSDKADGLYFSVTLPDTQLGRDTYELVARRDIEQCSYGAWLIESDINFNRATGKVKETITKAELREISIVTWGAIPGTSVEKAAEQEILASLRAGEKQEADRAAAVAALDLRLLRAGNHEAFKTNLAG